MSSQARARSQELRRAQKEAALRQAKRRRIFLAAAGLVIVGLIAAIVVVLVKAAGDDRELPPVTGDVVTPANLTPTGAIPVGDAKAPVTVEIYFDYMCPACGAFEAANSAELTRLKDDGTAYFELRPIAFLDEQSSGTEYSSRAANAIATTAAAAPDHVWAFHTALYENQPAEGSKGLTDDKIADIARDAGVPSDVVDQFTAGAYRQWVASVTQQAFDTGITGTPTVKIDGKVFDGNVFEEGPLTDAIEAAAAG